MTSRQRRAVIEFARARGVVVRRGEESWALLAIRAFVRARVGMARARELATMRDVDPAFVARVVARWVQCARDDVRFGRRALGYAQVGR